MNCLLTVYVVSEAPLLSKRVFTLSFGSLYIVTNSSCSLSAILFLITLAVVIASVEGAVVKEIYVEPTYITVLSCVAPADPVGIVKISPTTTSAVS